MKRTFQNPYRAWIPGFLFELAVLLGFLALLAAIGAVAALIR